MVLKNLLRKKLRTTFSVIGVGVGISLMVAMFTLSGDLLGQIVSLLKNERGDLVAVQSGRNILSSEISISPADGQPGLMDRLRAEPNVKRVTPMVWSYMTTEQRVGPASQLDYYGVVQDSPVVRSFEVHEHSKPGQPLIDDSDPNGLIVGRRLFELVNQQLQPERQLRVGQRLDMAKLLLDELSEYFVARGEKPWREMSPDEQFTYSMRKLKAAGIDPMAAASFEDLYIRATFTAPQPLMEAAIFFPLIRAQQLKGMVGKATVILIELEDTSDAAKQAAVTMLDQKYDQVRFSRSDQLDQEYAEYIDMFRDITWAISFIAALAGALGVLNIMVLAVHERTAEIGLLLAVGWSRSKILRGVLLEGVAITLMGGVLGIGLGVLEMVVVREWFNLIMLTPRVDPTMCAIALGVALVLGLLASLYPAWRAAKLTPMDALRRE